MGDVTEFDPSLLVSSRSIGDLGRSRLLAGLLVLQLPSANKARWGETAGLPETEAAAEAAAAVAADSSCCLRPKIWSIWGLGGLIKPAKGSLNPELGVVSRALILLGVDVVVLQVAVRAVGEVVLGPPLEGVEAGGLPAVTAAAAAAARSGRNMCMYSK